MVRVLVVSDIQGLTLAAQKAVRARLGSVAAGAVDWIERTPATLSAAGQGSEELAKAEVVLADPGCVVGLVDRANELRWMQSTWAGVNVLFDKTSRRDYVCTRIGGVFGPLMAEYVLGYILQMERRIPLAAQQQRQKKWDPCPFTLGTRPLSGLTLGLLGCGDIGSGIAKAVKSVGMQTVAFKTDTSKPVGCVDRLSSDLSDILSSADVIVNTLPSTPVTRGMLNGGALSACTASISRDGESDCNGVTNTRKRAPIFINVGRGDVISEAEIVRALDAGWISQAVLDVFETEPLPPSSVLWEHPRICITPHVSAISFPKDVATIFAENLARYIDVVACDVLGSQDKNGDKMSSVAKLRKELNYVVTWEKGY